MTIQLVPRFLAVPRHLFAVLYIWSTCKHAGVPEVWAFAPKSSFTRRNSLRKPILDHPDTKPTWLCASPLDKGFNLLETAGKFVPQGVIVKTSRESWKFIWRRMMAELAPQSKTGEYERPTYTFNEFIGRNNKHPDEPNRYQVYLGNPCPWCHRVRLVLALRGISSSEVRAVTLLDRPEQASRGGWVLQSTDPNYRSCRDLRQIYERLSPNYSGRCTAPLLIDTKTNTIVSNESSDIVRMLELATFGSDRPRRDIYPTELREAIDAANDWIYPEVNNGVYQCGFATTQEAYEEASTRVQAGLQRCDQVLSQQPFLCGDDFTEADLRLLPTILRYDGAYAPLFHAGGAHCSVRSNYRHIHSWLNRCWNDIEGVSASIDLADACGSYYKQLFPLNPSGIVPSPVTAESLGLGE